MIESIRSSIAAEYETNLRLERERHEQQVEQMRREHAEQLETAKLRETAGQQVKFNEALKKAVEQKDKELDLLKTSMSAASVMSLETQDVQELQRENEELKARLTRSMEAVVDSGKIVVSAETLKEGDHVMVVWSEPNGHYMVYTEGPIMHFLHSDSVVALGLSKTGNEVRYMTAQVVGKDFCQAKKAENRFRVPKGSRFYRVKCKPIERPNTNAAASFFVASASQPDEA